MENAVWVFWWIVKILFSIVKSYEITIVIFWSIVFLFDMSERLTNINSLHSISRFTKTIVFTTKVIIWTLLWLWTTYTWSKVYFYSNPISRFDETDAHQINTRLDNFKQQSTQIAEALFLNINDTSLNTIISDKESLDLFRKVLVGIDSLNIFKAAEWDFPLFDKEQSSFKKHVMSDLISLQTAFWNPTLREKNNLFQSILPKSRYATHFNNTIYSHKDIDFDIRLAEFWHQIQQEKRWIPLHLLDWYVYFVETFWYTINHYGTAWSFENEAHELIEEYVKEAFQQRNLEYLDIDIMNTMITLSNDDLQKYYNIHKDVLKTIDIHWNIEKYIQQRNSEICEKTNDNL